MSNLNTKCSQINIIISLKDVNVADVSNRLEKYLQYQTLSYCHILHDKDYDKNGIAKFPHIHCVLFNAPRKRLSTYINEISDYLKINPFAIQIEKAVNLEGCIQYLIHKNDIEKWQYTVDEIHTNIDKKDLDLFLNTENGCITFDRLFQIIRHSKNKTEVIDKIGLSYYRMYRSVIIDIWNDYKG